MIWKWISTCMLALLGVTDFFDIVCAKQSLVHLAGCEFPLRKRFV